MIRLKPNEKPDDPSLAIQQHINWLDPHADIVWMTYDEFYQEAISYYHNPDDFPDEIKAFIPKWREEAIEVEKSNRNFCPIKGAGIDIYYHGKKYDIGTEILAGIGNQYTTDWIFESIERGMEADLYGIGVDFVRYRGMID